MNERAGSIATATPAAPATPAGTAVRDAVAAAGAALVLCIGVATALGWTAASVVGAVLGVGIVLAAGASVVARPGRWSGPADRVTLGRAVLIGGCATLSLPIVAGELPARPWPLLVLAVPALVLDAVDGAVARRTRTSSASGGRLDGELDAALLMVLSVAAVRAVGWWVLAIGLMRYAFLAAGYLRARLRGELAFSQFRRAVAAVQGIMLAVALGPFVPVLAAQACAAVALVLLTVSFGRDVIHLERRGRADALVIVGAPRVDGQVGVLALPATRRIRTISAADGVTAPVQ